MMADYQPKSYGTGSQYTAPDATAASQEIEEQEQTDAAHEAEFGLPRMAAYLDPRTVANGTINQLTRGQFDRLFGNNNLRIESGRIVHTQGAGGAGNNAGYLQALLSAPIINLGCLAYWPSGASGGIANVIPSSRWDYPGLTDANVHLALDGAGQIVMGRFQISTGTVIDSKMARVRGFTNSPIHVIETHLIRSENRIIVTVDGLRYLNFVDADFFTNLTNYAVWELFEASNAIVPAQLLAVWADDAASIIPASRAPELAAACPIGLLDATGGVTDGTSGTFTTAGVGAYENITIQPALTFQYPEAGRILVRINTWVAVTGGDLLLRANGTGGSRVASAGFAGRINHEQVLTGTPGLNLGTALQWQAYMTAGSATFTKGGTIGELTISAIPLRF